MYTHTYIQYIVIRIYTIHMQTDRQETFSLAFLYIRCNVLCHHTYTLHCTCTSLPTQSSLTKMPLVKRCQCCMSHHAHTHAHAAHLVLQGSLHQVWGPWSKPHCCARQIPPLRHQLRQQCLLQLETAEADSVCTKCKGHWQSAHNGHPPPHSTAQWQIRCLN